MSLDNRFIPLTGYDQYLVEKTTGEPLTGGTVSFFKDSSRATPKLMYRLTGAPPNYSYTSVGSVLDIGASGEFVDDDGNNFLPYYFPYDGTPDNSTNTLELYYSIVKDEDGVSQFTREALPNLSDQGDDVQSVENFVPNGQFRNHIDLPETDTYDEGEIRSAVTALCYGGHQFRRPGGATSDDFALFERFDDFSSNPTSNPRYSLRLKCISADSSTYKIYRVYFPNVSKFSSSDQYYTYSFEAKSNSGSSVTVSLYLVRNFGTGGDPSSEIETSVSSFQITTSWDNHSHALIIPENAGYALGENNDDFVAFDIHLPPQTIYDISFDNIVLAPGNIVVREFPVETDSDFNFRGMFGSIPAPSPDGMDLYLPLKITRNGFEYDDSCIGDIVMESQVANYTSGIHDSTNRLYADGTRYKTDEYSPLGIPYLRLQEKIWISELNIPRFGTGQGYMNAQYHSDIGGIVISNNTPGSVTTFNSGTTSGFTFTRTHVGTSTYRVESHSYYRNSDFGFGVLNQYPKASATPPHPQTSGFATNLIHDSTDVSQQYFSVVPIAATTLAGKYFTFSAVSDADAFIDYYVWFKVNGAGSDPAPGGTGILVSLETADTARVVTGKIALALNAVEVTTVIPAAASGITGGQYFEIYTTEDKFYIWFKKDGVGADPMVASATGIQVDILAADTALQVAVKIQIAINSIYFAVPNLSRQFPRFLNYLNPELDNDRYGALFFDMGVDLQFLGSNELYDNVSHRHNFLNQHATGNVEAGPHPAMVADVNEQHTYYVGTQETRPRNTMLRPVIIY